MSPCAGLLAFTSIGTYLIDSSDNGVLTPAGIRGDKQNEDGASALDPVVVNNVAVYVQDDLKTVREAAYNFGDDAVVGNELTAASSHLFGEDDDTDLAIVDSAYAKYPDSVIYYVLSNGEARALTYMREHEVTGWSRITTDGEFESVAVIREGTRSVAYFSVKRTIDGSTRRTIERMAFRDASTVAKGWFLDCALRYSGSATTTITGLDHLEGHTVTAFADGDVVRDLVVSSGEVEIPVASEMVTVGIEYPECEARLLPVNPKGRFGPTANRRKTVKKVIARFRGTVSAEVGLWREEKSQADNDARLQRLKLIPPENWNDPLTPFRKPVETNLPAISDKDAIIRIVSNDPTYFEVLSVTPDYSENA